MKGREKRVCDVRLLRVLPSREVRCWDRDMNEIPELRGDLAVPGHLARARARLIDGAESFEHVACGFQWPTRTARQQENGWFVISSERFTELEEIGQRASQPVDDAGIRPEG